jgi:predicted PurR-regulated permease PerM
MSKNRSTSPLFTLVAIVTTIAALFFAKEILLPLALAILLSFLLTPLANTLERWRIPRVPATILVVAMSFAVLCALGWIVTIQLVDLSRELPNHKENLFAKVRSVRPDSQTITELSKTVEGLGKELTGGEQPQEDQDDAANQDGQADRDRREQPDQQETADDTGTSTPLADDRSPADAILPLEESADGEDGNPAVELRVVEMPPSPLAQIQTWLGPLVAPLTTVGMVIVMVFFILLDRENQRNRLIQLFGKSNLHRTTEAIHDAGRRIGRYLRMQFLINAGYGLTVALGLWLIGVPGAVMWGVLGFSLRFLPYVGPWIAAVMPIIVSVATSPGWTQPMFVVSLYIVLELLLNNVAEPLLYGGSTGVSTVGVILAAIFWTWLWGPIGLVLAMPITVCLVVMARYVPQLRFITVLLADQPTLTPSERLYQRLLAFDYNEPLRTARKHVKSSSLASFYDDLLIPALVLAEQDRHAGDLNDDQEDFVHEAAADLIEDLTDDATTTSQLNVQPDASAAVKLTSNADSPENGSFTQARILCVPLRDQADAAAGQMLAQLLAIDGFQVHVDAPESLSGEVVDHVAKLASELVVISILPPIAPRDSRLLWKRLRNRYPNLPIIVGYWNHAQSTEPLDPPEGDAQTKIATTLAEAVAMVRSTAAQLQSTGHEPPREIHSAAG